MRIQLTAIPLIIMLGGCAAGVATTDSPPPDAKSIILANKNSLWKDADSIKSASITAPFRNPVFSMAWLVCVRQNAKNGFGGYTGEGDSLIALHDQPEVLFEQAIGACGDLRHTPFPQLEGRGRRPT